MKNIHSLIDTNPVQGLSVPVTPQMAAIWKDKYHYDGQRPIRQWHVKNLAKMMVDGLFRENTQIAFAKVGDDLFLTNGQHTLSAIAVSQCTQKLCVVITPVNNMTEVADDFARHDTHLTRQFADSLVAHDVHSELGVSKTALHNIAAACITFNGLVTNTFVGTRSLSFTHDDKIKYVRSHAHLGIMAWGFFEGFHNKHYLTRRSTLATAMLCADRAPDIAGGFWKSIAQDDGLRQGDPRKTLLEWLKERSTPGGATGRAGIGKIASDQEFIKGIAICWNAWIEGRELKLIRVNFDDEHANFLRVGKFVVRGYVKKKK